MAGLGEYDHLDDPLTVIELSVNEIAAEAVARNRGVQRLLSAIARAIRASEKSAKRDTLLPIADGIEELYQ